ncbi:MAG: putative porin, partial [Methylophilales bacterium]|nr:putative porin [Methylophilales bacterium]
STTDIVNALVAKGVLTEEEGALLTKGRTDEAAGQAKALKKAGKVTVSDAIDNATIYGDMRVREEYRKGSGGYSSSGSSLVTANESRNRYRGKMTLGVKTDSGDWYSDLALAVGTAGRTDNFTFGGKNDKGTGTSPTDGLAISDKPQMNLKRAMLGFKATNWLTVEAGLMANPLYTTPMVWDADLTVTGLVEKLNFKVGEGDLFGNLVQMTYTGDRTNYDGLSSGGVSVTGTTNELLAFQGGYKFPITDKASAKVAATYYYYTHGNTGSGTPVSNANHGIFTPKLGTDSSVGSQSGVNNLEILEIPAEVNWMISDSVGMRVYGDYAVNLDASARAAAAAGLTPANATVYRAASGDDTAWLLGVVVGSAKDLKSFEGNKMKQGDWQARLWYQETGVYSLDPNTPDSDFMDSRLNMKGVVAKAQYNFKDNVALNAAYGHATRKNDTVGAVYAAGNDIGLNLTSFDLFQLDLTYKF